MPDQVCIEVPQVLDFCFQTEPFDVCLPLTVFTPAITACNSNVASCTITGASCTEVSRVAAVTPGFFNVTFLVTVTQMITISTTTGITVAATTNTTSFFKTVTLCAPDGATTLCDVTTSCGPCICIDDVVCCSFNLCLVFKSVFTVVLSVTGTVLTPTLCVQVSPFPPVCPPAAPTVCVNCPPV